MNNHPSLTPEIITAYVEQHIGIFHQKRLDKLEKLRLNDVIKRKNPYLFKAKNVLTSESLVKSILDAYLSSQEETLFGDFLEGLAIFICGQVYGGFKPPKPQNPERDFEGIDLIFERDDTLYIVEIKSGRYWGSSSQINKMLLNFDRAKAKLATDARYQHKAIIAVNGCSYGIEANPQQRDGAYLKLCGQDFWEFISGDDTLYLNIVEPIGYRARQRDDQFQDTYAMIINRFTRQFSMDFCLPNGKIDWAKLIRFVSAHKR